nr:MAG TPA: regulatory protein [Caudoviricetes sp.]
MQIAEQFLDSREVAEMVGKDHNMLLRDIRRYVEQLGQSKIAQSDFFEESTYQNSQNKTQPCYNVTKKGCEFIANKLTGIKGTEFTAKYIIAFMIWKMR